jgi:hypothetical protein
VDSVPDPLLLRKSGNAGNRTRASESVARNSDHWAVLILSFTLRLVLPNRLFRATFPTKTILLCPMRLIFHDHLNVLILTVNNNTFCFATIDKVFY